MASAGGADGLDVGHDRAFRQFERFCNGLPVGRAADQAGAESFGNAGEIDVLGADCSIDVCTDGKSLIVRALGGLAQRLTVGNEDQQGRCARDESAVARFGTDIGVADLLQRICLMCVAKQAFGGGDIDDRIVRGTPGGRGAATAFGAVDAVGGPQKPKQRVLCDRGWRETPRRLAAFQRGLEGDIAGGGGSGGGGGCGQCDWSGCGRGEEQSVIGVSPLLCETVQRHCFDRARRTSVRLICPTSRPSFRTGKRR
jgi:hypothetical protein